LIGIDRRTRVEDAHVPIRSAIKAEHRDAAIEHVTAIHDFHLTRAAFSDEEQFVHRQTAGIDNDRARLSAERAEGNSPDRACAARDDCGSAIIDLRIERRCAARIRHPRGPIERVEPIAETIDPGGLRFEGRG
jgi:hypothetical protein